MTDDKPIRIIRAAHESNYFVCSRKTAQDDKISYESLGVLTYLLSKPSTWEANVKDIAKRSSEYKTYKVLRELRKAGYLSLEKEKGQGRFSRWVYQVYEESQLLEFQQVENQLVENQHTKRVQKQSVEKTEKTLLDAQFDAIASTFKTKAAGYIVNLRGMLFSSNKVKGEWLKHQIQPPATLEEFADFDGYIFKRMNIRGIKDIPTTAETIERWYCDYREGLKEKVEPAPTSSPPVYKPSAKVQQREAEFQEWMKKGQPMSEEEF